MKIEVLRCPRHAQFWAIAVNDRRLTPGKCCGAWSSVVRWTIDGRSFVADLRCAVRGGLAGRVTRRAA